jgi:hypothetical protein
MKQRNLCASCHRRTVAPPAEESVRFAVCDGCKRHGFAIDAAGLALIQETFVRGLSDADLVDATGADSEDPTDDMRPPRR